MGKETNLTIRIDENVKKNAQQACEYFGTNFTVVINKALREKIKEMDKDVESKAQALKWRMQGELMFHLEELARAHIEYRNQEGVKLKLLPEVEEFLFEHQRG